MTYQTQLTPPKISALNKVVAFSAFMLIAYNTWELTMMYVHKNAVNVLLHIIIIGVASLIFGRMLFLILQTRYYHKIRDGLRSGDLEYLDTLLRSWQSIPKSDANGNTLLMYAAAYSNHPQILRFLIEEFGQVNAQNKFGTTALMFASANNPNLSIILTLLLYEADVTLKDSEGRTAHDLSNEMGYDDEHLLRLLSGESKLPKMDPYSTPIKQKL